jgi:cytochrome c-type biogenesis protein CcmF
MNYYEGRQQPIPTPAVRSTATEDLFINLTAFEQNGSSATLKMIVTPLVSWLWLGSAVMVLGTIVAIWPRKKPPPAGAPDAGVRRSAAPARKESATSPEEVPS